MRGFQIGVFQPAFLQVGAAFQVGAFQNNFQHIAGEAAAGATVDRGVVLFPAEPLRFRSRWDKTAYAWSVFARDMRAPADGYRQGKDHLVSAVRLAAR